MKQRELPFHGEAGHINTSVQSVVRCSTISAEGTPAHEEGSDLPPNLNADSITLHKLTPNDLVNRRSPSSCDETSVWT